MGQPALGYEEVWSIVRKIEGQSPVVVDPRDPVTPDRADLATELADVILALRNIEVTTAAATDPALRWYRGGPLAAFDAQTRHNIEVCRTIQALDLDLDAVLRVWRDAVALPRAGRAEPERWFHSDLVAENLLISEGRLVAVLDFGGLAIGDPTVDLHGAWEVLDASAREVLRKRLGVAEEAWLLGRAWALGIAVGAIAYYWGKMPERMRDRLAMARAVLGDAGF